MSNPSHQRHHRATFSIPDPREADHITYNPSTEDLRAFAQDDEITTEFGSPSFVSRETSRNADLTKNDVDASFEEADYTHVETAIRRVQEEPMLCLDRQLGEHPAHSYVCRYFVPESYARIALGWEKLLEPADAPVDPDFVTIQLPDHDHIAIRVLPEVGLTAVLGSDYIGEAKKSFLRQFMYRVKRHGGLGLHAGSKRVTVDRNGELVDVGQLFLGLSATGKTTLTVHSCWLDEPEGTEVVQDDVCALLEDGSVIGTEGGGMYVKTSSVNPKVQPSLYRALVHESAVFENVTVEEDGTVDFDATRYTSNGRAVIDREQLGVASESIDLDDVDQTFFITRNPIMPPVAKLTPNEAGAAFMLGESIETSAGDPERAGEPIRVVGTNPFIIGSRGEEGNRFRDLVVTNDIETFVLNTGHLGAEAKDIRVEDTVAILRAIARGSVEWSQDESIAMTIPRSVPDVAIEEFDVTDHVDDVEEQLRALREERQAYLEQFDDLDPAIKQAVY